MRVENLHFNTIHTMKPASQVYLDAPEGQNRSVETSIYGSKGVTLPFGTWAKGANAVEESCIIAFRKVREGRVRKYDEPQIVGFMRELTGVPEGRNIKQVVDEMFEAFKICVEEFGTSSPSSKPDAALIKNYLSISKNCDDDQYFALMGFMKHELCTDALRPLETLANAEPAHQKRFLKTMCDIAYDFGSDEAKSAVLYDDLRHVMFAAEELPTLDAKGKLQYLSDVQHDYNRMKAAGEDEKLLRISREIVDMMMDVLKI